MSRPVLATTRLQLRPMTLEHLPLLVDLDSDPEVMRYLIGRARTRPEAEEFWVPRCADESADTLGLGWWAGFAGDDFVGWWDLGRSDSDPSATVAHRRPEAGWRLRRAFWRQGLASEGAIALLDHGFRTVGVDAVWAETMAVNQGSRGVMRRLGMRHIATEVREWDDPLPGSDLGEVVYEITREEWLRR
ncbi:GNAT family N-acetyltransferase [Rudaeicoccus suwonensis]|uniref:RimJ/RimL family protein N-acetyltransferase n=1 Tax=Rudaeicoccus suwonensis TaxID=657409 RepID=A0A561E8N2_9MICO|nr:GNAT family N-acetyltransferase [Rudaeicoccus suwonensis]TWE11963.1 RimJ/RimL family protein N-acetyltransferase [Rudaeicoccus suwonensis]